MVFTTDELRMLVRLIECPECSGRGKVELGAWPSETNYVQDGNEPVTGTAEILRIRCPSCAGSGLINQTAKSPGQ